MNTRKNPLSPLRYALTVAVLLASGAAIAAPPGDGPRWKDGARHGPPGAEQQLARLDQALDLSDTQSEQLLALLQSAEAERESLQARIAEQFRPEICALRDETEAGILEVLTPEQAEAFGQLQEERRGRFDRGWGRGVPGLDCDDTDN